PGELATFLEQSLADDIKIPLLRDEFDTFLVSGYQDPCTAEDLETLFRVSDTESAYTFVTGVLGSAIMTPSPALDISDRIFKYNVTSAADKSVSENSWTVEKLTVLFSQAEHHSASSKARMLTQKMAGENGVVKEVEKLIGVDMIACGVSGGEYEECKEQIEQSIKPITAASPRKSK
ncbi:5582_t:CDS:2, partial [Paraglomus occultum]